MFKNFMVNKIIYKIVYVRQGSRKGATEYTPLQLRFPQGAWLCFRISSLSGAVEYTPLQLEALTSRCRLNKCSKQFISIL